VRLLGRRGEAAGVRGLGRQVQPVAGRLGAEHGGGSAGAAVRLQQPAQPGDVTVQGGGHGCWWTLAPHQVDQPVQGDDLAGVEGEGGQQRSLLLRAEVHLGTGMHHLEAAQHPDLHVGSVGRRERLGRLRGGDEER
jgi:hypothetical protein